MNDKPQWVISRYAPETGEKFEVVNAYAGTYCIRRLGVSDVWNVPDTEYLPTTPPERWETVPITEALQIDDNQRDIWKRARGFHWACDDERFVIKDGRLVLQRRMG